MNKQQVTKTAVIKYCVGFALSLLLTLGAFYVVSVHVASGHKFPSDSVAEAIVVCLAVVQLLVQLFFFLHLGGEKKPRLNLVVFLFMMIVLVILVVGSIWIMDNLHYHAMSGEETVNYLHDHPGAF